MRDYCRYAGEFDILREYCLLVQQRDYIRWRLLLRYTIVKAINTLRHCFGIRRHVTSAGTPLANTCYARFINTTRWRLMTYGITARATGSIIIVTVERTDAWRLYCHRQQQPLILEKMAADNRSRRG